MTIDRETELQSYISTLLWSTTGDDGENLDYDGAADDIAPAALAEMTEDVDNFLDAADSADLELWHAKLGAGSIGHDFALTRNHHGAGFWDRFYGGTPEEAAGDRLTSLAHPFGESSPYVGDDGSIYV